MSPDGTIKDMDKLTKEEKKTHIPIPKEEIGDVTSMCRAERRRWYREHKKTWKPLTVEELEKELSK